MGDAVTHLGPRVPDHLRRRRQAVCRGAGRGESIERDLRVRAARAARAALGRTLTPALSIAVVAALAVLDSH